MIAGDGARMPVKAGAKTGSPLLNLIAAPLRTSSHRLGRDTRETIKSLLEPGDVLLTADNTFPIAQIVDKMVFGTNWTHAGLYVGNGAVVDARAKRRVSEIPVDVFLRTHHAAVFRPRYKSEADVKSAIDYVHAQVGKPYISDIGDLAEDGKFYCSKLIYFALQHMPNPIAVPLSHVFGKTIVSPGAFEKSGEFYQIWSSEPNFWKNLASHLPLAVQGLPAGPVRAALGAVFGAARSTKAKETNPEAEG